MSLAPEYDICLSFAGEEREYVEAVADALRGAGVSVFYDAYEEVELWGKDLYQHLADVYQRAKYCVVFASAAYARKLWTRHELKAAQARAFQENREYILPVRFDDTEIPGLLSTVMYIDLRTRTPQGVAEMIVRKLRTQSSPSTAPESRSAGPTAAAVRPPDVQPWQDLKLLHGLRYRVSEPLQAVESHREYLNRLVQVGKWSYTIGVGEPPELLRAEDELESRLGSFARELRQAAGEIDAAWEQSSKTMGGLVVVGDRNRPIRDALLHAAVASEKLKDLRPLIRQGIELETLRSTQLYQSAAKATAEINEAIRAVREKDEQISALWKAVIHQTDRK